MTYAMQNQLNYWYNKYVEEPAKCTTPTFAGYDGEKCAGSTMGTFHPTVVDEKKSGYIHLAPWLEKRPRLAEAVLWHEFCHAEVWFETKDRGHGMEFKDRQKRNKKLYYLDLLAKFLCPLLRAC